MDATSKEFETWNLTFLGVLAKHINLMLKKYFSVLVVIMEIPIVIVNVICKLLNVETDKTATLKNVLNVKCCIPTCYNSDFVSHSYHISHLNECTKK